MSALNPPETLLVGTRQICESTETVLRHAVGPATSKVTTLVRVYRFVVAEQQRERVLRGEQGCNEYNQEVTAVLLCNPRVISAEL